MKFLLVFIFILLLTPTIVYAQPIISNWKLSKTTAYENETVVLTVDVVSENVVKSMKANVTNYTISMGNPVTTTVSLGLSIGNSTNGTWFYFFSEEEGIYSIDSLNATDTKNSTFLDEHELGVLAFKVIKRTVTITCNVLFSLNETEFNSSEVVNYTIVMENLGSSLNNLNFSIEGLIQTDLKELVDTTLSSGQMLDLEFDFIAPNVSEDTNYPFSLYVSSDECNFTYPFQFKIKEPEEEAVSLANTSWESILDANNSIQLSRLENKDVSKAEILLDQAVQKYEQEDYEAAKQMADRAKLLTELAEELPGGIELPSWFIIVMIVVPVAIVVIVLLLYIRGMRPKPVVIQREI